MFNFIAWNTADQLEQGWTAVSHPDLLHDAPNGCQWVPIDGDAVSITVAPDAEGKLVQVARPRSLESAQAAAYLAITTERDASLRWAKTSKGTANSDDLSMTLISAMVGSITSGLQTDPIEWRMFDNSTQTFSPNDFIAFAHEVAGFRANVMKDAWTRKDAVMASITVDEVALALNS